jgi:hypothetical protein
MLCVPVHTLLPRRGVGYGHCVELQMSECHICGRHVFTYKFCDVCAAKVCLLCCDTYQGNTVCEICINSGDEDLSGLLHGSEREKTPAELHPECPVCNWRRR